MLQVGYPAAVSRVPSSYARRDRADAVEHRLDPIAPCKRELPGERTAHDVVDGADALADRQVSARELVDAAIPYRRAAGSALAARR